MPRTKRIKQNRKITEYLNNHNATTDFWIRTTQTNWIWSSCERLALQHLVIQSKSKHKAQNRQQSCKLMWSRTCACLRSVVYFQLHVDFQIEILFAQLKYTHTHTHTKKKQKQKNTLFFQLHFILNDCRFCVFWTLFFLHSKGWIYTNASHSKLYGACATRALNITRKPFTLW